MTTRQPRAAAEQSAPCPYRGPGEAELEAILEQAGIAFTRPEIDQTDPANFDFKVSSLGVYVEVKQRMPGRLRRQMRRVPRSTTVLCIIGPNAARDLLRLSALLAPATKD